MGIYYLISISADELDEAKDDKRENLEKEVGEAVVNLCVDLSYYAKSLDGKRITYHKLGHSDNAVIYCDEVHSNDIRIYAWIGNKLSRIQNLHDVDFDTCAKQFEEIREWRKSKPS